MNGIREFAQRRGAAVSYVPVVAPDLRVDRDALSTVLAGADRSEHNLFAFPAQSNFSGVQHPLELVAEAHEHGWDVLLDAAAYVPTNRLDLDQVRPDFVALSFYKMFGFPSGVGCLLVRKDRRSVLQRPWFAGGTITIASVQGDGHYLHDDEAGFEDGTVDYLNLPAVETGLRFLERIGRDDVHTRVAELTAWLLDALIGLRHANGERVVRILGPTDTVDRGGTVTFLMRDPDGRPIDDRRVEELANREDISLRTGCFCNPGAGEIAHHLGAADMTRWFERDEAMSFLELREQLLAEHDLLVAASGSRSASPRTSPTSTGSCASCRASSTARSRRSAASSSCPTTAGSSATRRDVRVTARAHTSGSRLSAWRASARPDPAGRTPPVRCRGPVRVPAARRDG